MSLKARERSLSICLDGIIMLDPFLSSANILARLSFVENKPSKSNSKSNKSQKSKLKLKSNNPSKQKRNNKKSNPKKLQKQNKPKRKNKKSKRKNNKSMDLSSMTLKENSKTVKINFKLSKIFWTILIKKKSVSGKSIMTKILLKEKFFTWLKTLQMEVFKELRTSENQLSELGEYMDNKATIKFVELWSGKELKSIQFGSNTHLSNITNSQSLILKMKTINNLLSTTLWKLSLLKVLLFNLPKESYEPLYLNLLFKNFYL